MSDGICTCDDPIEDACSHCDGTGLAEQSACADVGGQPPEQATDWLAVTAAQVRELGARPNINDWEAPEPIFDRLTKRQWRAVVCLCDAARMEPDAPSPAVLAERLRIATALTTLADGIGTSDIADDLLAMARELRGEPFVVVTRGER